MAKADSVAGYAVQVGSFGDSVNATNAAAGLAKDGWAPDVQRATVSGAPRWRVLVGASRDKQYAATIAAQFASAHRDAVVVPATVADDSPRIVVVNGGSHGMAARVRWALSRDENALVVTEDPAAVEAEPVPNGVVLANEARRSLVQVDSVWDAAPSPEWNTLLVGRAYSTRGEGDTPKAAEWVRVAKAAGTTPDSARKHAFVSSGMSVSYALARAGVGPLSDGSQPGFALVMNATPNWVGPLAGWRVAWSREGDAMLLGEAPASALDDAAPLRWIAVNADGSPLTPAPERNIVRWTTGPTLDMSVPVTLDSSVRVGVRIIGAQGWIVRDARIVGAGRPLAATRDGLFIAALAPNAGAGKDEPNSRLVVYVIAP